LAKPDRGCPSVPPYLLAIHRSRPRPRFTCGPIQPNSARRLKSSGAPSTPSQAAARPRPASARTRARPRNPSRPSRRPLCARLRRSPALRRRRPSMPGTTPPCSYKTTRSSHPCPSPTAASPCLTAAAAAPPEAACRVRRRRMFHRLRRPLEPIDATIMSTSPRWSRRDASHRSLSTGTPSPPRAPAGHHGGPPSPLRNPATPFHPRRR
jgi:hypothetical protein